MNIKKFVLGMFQVNCYVGWCENTKKAFMVDPGLFSQKIVDYIKENKLDLGYIILTHAHGDHIGGLPNMLDIFDAKVITHEDEAFILRDPRMNFSGQMFSQPIAIEPDRVVKDGEIIEVGDLKLTVIHTPGHTPGGMCLYSKPHLFSGDTLFAQSIGRTDFPLSSTEDLFKGIKEKLYALPHDTKVYSGHGPDTEIGYEKRNNMFVRG